jgi:hypothetical protein
MSVNILCMDFESSQSVSRFKRKYRRRKGRLHQASCHLQTDAEHSARLAIAENTVSLISKC